MNRLACRLLVLVVAVVPVTAQTFTTRHYDAVRPLTLDGTQVAVSVADDGLLADALASVGVQALGVRDLIGTHRLVELPAGTDAVALAAQLAADGRAGLVSPVFVDDLGGPMLPTERILLRFVPGTPRAEQERLLDDLALSAGVSVLAGPGWAHLPDAWKLSVDTRDGTAVMALANALADRADVRFATPSFVISGRGDALIPGDPLFGDSWGLHNIGQDGGTADEDMDAPEAWEIRLGDPDIITVILDTGVEQTHPDIGQVPGADFVFEGFGGGPGNACDNHGTPVAGCVSGLADNSIGSTGSAPGSLIASARCFISSLSCDGSWSTFLESTPDALAWAESIGARVSNNSNFYGFTDAATEDAYALTRDNGMVHFASAGNFGTATVEYPSSLPTIVAVNATDRFGGLAWFTSWGVGLGLSAPGLDIMTTDRTGFDGYVGGDYGLISGTSFSSPYTAGVAALVLSRNPYLSATDVEDILFGSAVDHGTAGYDTLFGHGVVNAHQALLDTPAFVTTGGAFPGSLGDPVLAAVGTLEPASAGSTHLDNVPPQALTALFLAASSTPVPFKGGTLQPFPFLPPVFLTADGQGRVDLAWTWPSGLPADAEAWLQFGISDPGAANGVSLSNGVVGVTP